MSAEESHSREENTENEEQEATVQSHARKVERPEVDLQSLLNVQMFQLLLEIADKKS